MSNLRNAFAHQDAVVGFRLGEPDPVTNVKQLAVVIESIKSSGELEAMTRDEAYAKFVPCSKYCMDTMKTILSRLGVVEPGMYKLHGSSDVSIK